jgi:hypothetical protein
MTVTHPSPLSLPPVANLSLRLELDDVLARADEPLEAVWMADARPDFPVAFAQVVPEFDMRGGRVEDLGGRWVVAAQVTGIVCGGTSGVVEIRSLDGILRARANVTFAAPQVHAATPAVLAAEGGTVVRIRGSNFGFANVSDPLNPVVRACAGVWATRGMALVSEATRTSQPPSQTPLWAYVGLRPCQQLSWVSEEELDCVAPPGVGANLAVTVTVDGVVVSRSDLGLAYADLLPPTALTPATGAAPSGDTEVLASLPLTPWLHAATPFLGFTLVSAMVGPFTVTGPLTVSSTASVSLTAPVGIGAGHAVSFCVVDDPASFTTVGASRSSRGWRGGRGQRRGHRSGWRNSARRNASHRTILVC